MNHGGFVTIVEGKTTPLLVTRRYDDIRREPFGIPSRRPMVYFANPHEALEKALWCHLNGMPCVIGESNVAVSLSAAAKFRIDSLIADAASLVEIATYLESHEPLESISLVGTSFDEDVVRLGKHLAARVRVVLTRPETGAVVEVREY